MFFRTSEPHGLKHHPFLALVAPRPIGWISSMDGAGRVNLAPYSFFNGVAFSPPQVMFSVTGVHPQGGGMKDTLANVRETGEFVVNYVTWGLREAMNATSVSSPHGVDELALAGLTPEPAITVRVPRVKESPVHLECRFLQTAELPSNSPAMPNTVVFGQVLGIHIDDRVIEDGLIRYDRLEPIARMGYMDYARPREFFAMDRPVWSAKEGAR